MLGHLVWFYSPQHSLGLNECSFVSLFHFFLVLGLLEVSHSLLSVPFSHRAEAAEFPSAGSGSACSVRNPPRRGAYLLPLAQRQETFNKFMPAAFLQHAQVVAVVTPVNT